jgi:hypothetical protein
MDGSFAGYDSEKSNPEGHPGAAALKPLPATIPKKAIQKATPGRRL